MAAMTADSIRPAVTAFARGLADMGANPADPDRRSAYLAMIAPGETPARAAGMADMSGCALVARAILRRFIVHPILERTYRDQHAVSDLVQIAIDARALRSPLIPQEGDIVIVGGGSNGGGPEHAWTCLDVTGDPYDAGNGLLVTGLDGGQRDDAGLECIRVVDRELRGGVDHTEHGGRVVRWVVDVQRVVEKFGR